MTKAFQLASQSQTVPLQISNEYYLKAKTLTAGFLNSLFDKATFCLPPDVALEAFGAFEFTSIFL